MRQVISIDDNAITPKASKLVQPLSRKLNDYKGMTAEISSLIEEEAFTAELLATGSAHINSTPQWTTFAKF